MNKAGQRTISKKYKDGIVIFFARFFKSPSNKNDIVHTAKYIVSSLFELSRLSTLLIKMKVGEHVTTFSYGNANFDRIKQEVNR